METLIPVVGSSNPGTRGRNARGSTGNDPISNTIAMNIGAGLGAFATIIGVIPTPITFGIGRVLQIAGAAVTPGALGDGLKDSQ
ncbi:MAG: hypothetical protein GJ671_11595 [Alteromonadaceae bacterium]|nr:hypothetical protein [Alteromonadaceae bacterium]